MLLVDTGPLMATADRDDRHHEVCRQLLESHPGPLVTTPLVATEAGWLIRRQLDARAESIFYEAIAAGDITVEHLTPADWQRMAELITTYADLGLDAADASVVALAERFNLDTVATLDARDFQVVKPAHCEAFTLLPVPRW